jgi:hypothetical protein
MVRYIIILVLVWFMLWLIFRNRCPKHKWRRISNEKYQPIGFREYYRDIYECENCGKIKKVRIDNG